MLEQESLDLGRVGVEASDDEHVFLASDDPQPAGLGELAEISGVQPAVGVDRLGGGRRIVQVALHHVVARAPAPRVSSAMRTSIPSHGSPAVVATSSAESPGRDSVTLPASVRP